MGKITAGRGFLRLDQQNSQEASSSMPLLRPYSFAKLSKVASTKDVSHGSPVPQRVLKPPGRKLLPAVSCSNLATVMSSQQSSVPCSFCSPRRLVDVTEDEAEASNDRFKKILSFLMKWLLPVLLAASLVMETVTVGNPSVQGRPAAQSQIYTASTVHTPKQAQDGGAQTVLQKAHPAVVSVHQFSTSQNHESRLAQFKERLPGTGVVWDDKGHIVTSYSSIRDSSSVKVAFSSGEKRLARIIGVDEASDVAVLQVQGSNFESMQSIDFNTHKGVGAVLNVENPKGRVMSISSGMFIEESQSCEARWKPYKCSFSGNKGVLKGVLVDTQHRLVGFHDPIGSGGIIRTPHLMGIVDRII